MKIGKVAWIAILVGAILIGGISLFLALDQQTDQKEDLKKELDAAKVKLAAIDNDELLARRELLLKEIQECTDLNNEVREKLVYQNDSIDITGAVISDAADVGVKILEIRSPGKDIEILNGLKYQTINVGVRAVGTTRTIADFVYSLKKIFPTGVIKSVSLEFLDATNGPVPAVPGQASSENPEVPAVVTTSTSSSPAENIQDTIVNINFVVYNYKGEY